MNQNNDITLPRPSRQPSYSQDTDGNLVRREPMVWNLRHGSTTEESMDMDVDEVPVRVPVPTRQNGTTFTAPPDPDDGWTWDSFAPRVLLAEYVQQLPSKGVTAQVLLGWFKNPDPVTHPAWAAYARRYASELTEFENAQNENN
jgi:hypothetical protein